VHIVRQLDDAGRLRRDGEITAPAFGPTKTKTSSTINLCAETLRLLREHKRQQAELKMKNRATYRDLGLVFALEPGDCFGEEAGLGLPMPVGTLGGRVFKRLMKAAKVRPITFHSLRHTCASLLMATGEPMKVVQ
jgi:integrase